MKIALIGYGKMGKMIERLAPAKKMEVACTFEIDKPIRADQATRQKLRDVSVLIDFSFPEAVIDNVKTAAALGINLVEGTTGWHQQLEEVQKIIRDAKTGMVYASNFSLGVNLFYKIIERAGECMSAFDNYDTYIEESHHKFKRDAPSGTALMLKNILQAHYQQIDIPVTSVRAGYIPGTHSIGFDSTVDSISLTHTARSREGLAEGALLAADWLGANRKGFFEFGFVLNSMMK